VRARLDGTSASRAVRAQPHGALVGARPTAGGQSGSVGLPAYTDSAPVRHSMQMGAPHARYAVLERKKASGPVADHVPRRRL
jgi:hypothetical protein